MEESKTSKNSAPKIPIPSHGDDSHNGHDNEKYCKTCECCPVSILIARSLYDCDELRFSIQLSQSSELSLNIVQKSSQAASWHIVTTAILVKNFESCQTYLKQIVKTCKKIHSYQEI